jgi:hypothetical protein
MTIDHLTAMVTETGDRKEREEVKIIKKGTIWQS